MPEQDICSLISNLALSVDGTFYKSIFHFDNDKVEPELVVAFAEAITNYLAMDERLVLSHAHANNDHILEHEYVQVVREFIMYVASPIFTQALVKLFGEKNQTDHIALDRTLARRLTTYNFKIQNWLAETRQPTVL